MAQTGMAAEFDASVDENIRKDYIESADLPPLPKALPGNSAATTITSKESVSEKEKSTIKVSTPSATVYKGSGKVYTIKSGTKIILTSKSAISDSMAKGSLINFSLLNPVITKEGVTIPSGTSLRGRVTDSHGPQIGANGGLVEININEIYFNGVWSKINTRIASAKSKRVAFNDVKGQHSYWKNFNKSMKPGRTIYRATNEVAHVMFPIPVVNILSIVPWSIGAVCYSVNGVVSPFIAAFTKGGKLYLPAGTEFEIKFTGETKING